MSRYAFLTPQDANDGSIEIALIVPQGWEWEALARGALALLLSEENFEQAIGSSITPEETAQEFLDYISYTFENW